MNQPPLAGFVWRIYRTITLEAASSRAESFQGELRGGGPCCHRGWGEPERQESPISATAGIQLRPVCFVRPAVAGGTWVACRISWAGGPFGEMGNGTDPFVRTWRGSEGASG